MLEWREDRWRHPARTGACCSGTLKTQLSNIPLRPPPYVAARPALLTTLQSPSFWQLCGYLVGKPAPNFAPISLSQFEGPWNLQLPFAILFLSFSLPVGFSPPSCRPLLPPPQEHQLAARAPRLHVTARQRLYLHLSHRHARSYYSTHLRTHSTHRLHRQSVFTACHMVSKSHISTLHSLHHHSTQSTHLHTHSTHSTLTPQSPPSLHTSLTPHLPKITPHISTRELLVLFIYTPMSSLCYIYPSPCYLSIYIYTRELVVLYISVSSLLSFCIYTPVSSLLSFCVYTPVSSLCFTYPPVSSFCNDPPLTA